MSVHFDLVDLRLMVRVAEANSLTKGAEASHISLPAASTRIKNLEESIGAKLLNRHSQGVTLTPPGQAFVHRARLVLGELMSRGLSRLTKIWVDGGYRGKLINWAKAWTGWVLEVVLRPADQVGFKILPRRWVVERTFGWLGRYGD